MFLDIKKLLLILLGLTIFCVGIFFFAFILLFLIPVFFGLFIFRKYIFRKLFEHNLNLQSKEAPYNNKTEYIEAEYKKEKEEEV